MRSASDQDGLSAGVKFVCNVQRVIWAADAACSIVNDKMQ
jgi:hypothetical protein